MNSFLGWFGPLSRPVQAVSLVGSGAFRVPGVKTLYAAAADRLIKGSTGGPDAGERARGGSHVVGAAYDPSGKLLAEVHLSGVDAYTFTGEILAWGRSGLRPEASRAPGRSVPSTASVSTSSKQAVPRRA